MGGYKADDNMAAEVDQLMKDALEGHDDFGDRNSLTSLAEDSQRTSSLQRRSSIRFFNQRRIARFAEYLHSRNKMFVDNLPSDLDDEEESTTGSESERRLKQRRASSYHWENDENSMNGSDGDSIDLRPLVYFPTTPAHFDMKERNVVRELTIVQGQKGTEGSDASRSNSLAPKPVTSTLQPISNSLEIYRVTHPNGKNLLLTYF